eukprot:CAMPEP_0185727438 /NCGR_PEP_ID=MMETSP1171-20130828/3132_1 /TAXON_ID=374046 /ORGANISM="Helicotheca tamensis, Strain CCMP826" /LENGTH=400 /DNA_ID=CAMNT_0028396013 /DNA_START=76 /DNA_END=1278 /DNA_ORIENTATION=-
MEKHRKVRSREALSLVTVAAISGAIVAVIVPSCDAFTVHAPPFVTRSRKTIQWSSSSSSRSSLQMIYAPPGSGYSRPSDEQDHFPESYDPMMEYPGTMRPGRTPENQAFHDLPIGDDDPDPVPWPHFQEIEWHHNWGAPHDHPIPMEEFIELEGRWASVEDEAAMRAGARRGVRERRELEEMEKAATLIMDDDDDDEEEGSESGVRLDLGDGVEALIGSNALTAGAESTPSTAEADKKKKSSEEDEEDGDDFLLDLGLDFGDSGGDSGSTEKETAEGEDDDSGDEPAFATSSDDSSTQGLLEAMQSMIDMGDDEDEGADVAGEEDDDDDGIDLSELGLTDDDDDDDDEESDMNIDLALDDDGGFGGGGGGGIEEVPLDDLSQEEDMGDDDSFDDGGFDYE